MNISRRSLLKSGVAIAIVAVGGYNFVTIPDYASKMPFAFTPDTHFISAIQNGTSEYWQIQLMRGDTISRDSFNKQITPESVSYYEEIEMVDDSLIFRINRASSAIARITRRGRGNHLAIFSDHILVWFAMHNKTALQKSIGNGPCVLFDNQCMIAPNFTKFFSIIKVDTAKISPTIMNDIKKYYSVDI